MLDYTEYFDDKINRDVRMFTHRQRQYRFPAVLANRFEIVRLLNCGGFGILLVAKDRRIFDRNVLIKAGLIRPHVLSVPRNVALSKELDDLGQRMEHERKMLLQGQLRGVSGIPILIDWFDDVSPMVRGPHRDPNGNEFFNEDPRLWQSVRYLAVSYFDGIELGDFCASPRFSAKPLASCRYLGFYLTNTLGAFHRNEQFGNASLQFFYQDLKPSNILVSREGFYSLIDFGSFAVVSPKKVIPGTQTDGYAAPELKTLDLRSACTPRLDIYSLGIVLKECLQIAAGKKPLKVNPPASELGLPDAWREVLDRCTHCDPQARFQTMQEVNDALRNLPY
jgi:serine/threonine protein kinase